MRILHRPVRKWYSAARLISFDEQATQCRFGVGEVFQLPQLLQKLATSVFSPQLHCGGWNRLVETSFLQLRHDQRNKGIRNQKKMPPHTAATATAPTASHT